MRPPSQVCCRCGGSRSGSRSRAGPGRCSGAAQSTQRAALGQQADDLAVELAAALEHADDGLGLVRAPRRSCATCRRARSGPSPASRRAAAASAARMRVGVRVIGEGGWVRTDGPAGKGFRRPNYTAGIRGANLPSARSTNAADVRTARKPLTGFTGRLPSSAALWRSPDVLTASQWTHRRPVRHSPTAPAEAPQPRGAPLPCPNARSCSPCPTPARSCSSSPPPLPPAAAQGPAPTAAARGGRPRASSSAR